jgi:hypothetical protein
MRDRYQTGHAERQAAASEAKKALLAKMKVKPTVTAPVFESREERKAKELEKVRAERAAVKEKARLDALDRQANDLELKRQERRDRKAAFKADQRARREAKSATRRTG